MIVEDDRGISSDKSEVISKQGDASLLGSPVTLPCGVEVPNRLVKVAMYEHLCSIGGGPPNKRHFGLYSTWAKGDWGVIITGNVQVSPSHLSLGSDLAIPALDKPYDVDPWQKLAAAMHSASAEGRRPLALMQLNHTGRQSPRFIGGRAPWDAPLAPSRKRVGSNVENESWISNLMYRILFQQPREMKTADIDRVVEQFCVGAKIAFDAGFDGVQIHASHGYLLTQFISPKTNLRTDKYAEPLFLLKRIVFEIRKAVPAEKFVMAVKFNAGDYVQGGMTESESLEHIAEIARWRVFDIIEISGGDYENPEFTISNRRQAFFASFSRRAMEVITTTSQSHQAKNGASSPHAPMVLLTGSLRGRPALASAIRNKHASLVGLARPSVTNPYYPRFLVDPSLQESQIPDIFEPSIPAWLSSWLSKLAGGSVGTMWYCYEMIRIANAADRGKQYAGPSSTPPLWRVVVCFVMSLYWWLLATVKSI